MPKLLLASTNAGKLREIRDLLKDLDFDICSPAELDIELHVKEDGDTYAENAASKALAFARRAGLLSLADDSGLEVDALDGAPGLYSARYSPQPGFAGDFGRCGPGRISSKIWLTRCRRKSASPTGRCQFGRGGFSWFRFFGERFLNS